MKKFITFILFAGFACSVFSQQTFSSKVDALAFLKESFAKNFIKEPVIVSNNNKAFSYDYIINEEHLVIIIKTEGETTDKWVTVPYTDISEYYTLAKNDYFKKVMGLGFKAAFGESYGVSYGKPYKQYESGTAYTLKAVFPFHFQKDEEKSSVKNAVSIIAQENKAIAKASKKLSDNIELKSKEDAEKVWENKQTIIEKKIKGQLLPPYKMFTSENTEVNIYAYLLEKRQYKTKPSLVITWGNWCPICLRKIDTLLNKDLALKYNIILINKQPTTGNLSVLLKNIANHIPDYNKDALLLFDKNNQMKDIDHDGTPFFLWLDTNLKVMSSFEGYNINIQKITEKLEEIK